MSAGLARDKAQIDAKVGALAAQTRELLAAWRTTMDSLNDIDGEDNTGLLAIYGVQEDVDRIRNAAANGVTLANLAGGAAWGGDLGDARDLAYHWRRVWGV